MRTCLIEDFPIPTDYRVQMKEKQKEIKVLRPCQRTKKAVEHKGDINTSCIWRA